MNRRTVCIVGKPNVGKSTLFNKIVGRRVSITEGTPGVTRDRIYAEAEWTGRHFTVIDTGGLDIKSEDEFMKGIIWQADIAIDTADVIIFVIDGVTGATSLDYDIANILRKSGKAVILAVNKSDTKGVSESFYDYFEFGFGEPIMISAENSLGLGDLLDRVVENLPENEKEEDEDRINVAFIGKPNVGKSSLVNKLIGEERSIVTDIPGTTRDTIDSKFDFNGEKYLLLDTAGMRKRKKIYESVERYSVVRSLSAIDRSDVCVCVIDATDGVSEQDTKIIGYAHDAGKALVIAVNKWDLIESKDEARKKFEEEICRVLSFVDYAPRIYISAVTGVRLEKLLDLIADVYENYSRELKRGALNDVLNRAVLMNQPPADKGKPAKIYYVNQIATKPPKFLFFVNDKELIHFSYMRYLENQLRENFDFEGTPISLVLRERKDNE